MKVNVQGTISACLQQKSGISKTTGKEWVTQDFVLAEQDGSLLVFTVFGREKIEQYNLVAGKQVSISVEISAKKYQEKYFTSVICSAIYENNIKKDCPRPQYEQKNEQKVEEVQNNSKENAVVADDLPF